MGSEQHRAIRHADKEQQAADQDQLAADGDAAAATKDQDQSDIDQRASDSDQRASDRDAEGGGDSEAVHEQSAEQREAATRQRREATADRADAAGERADNAARRDAAAGLRELAAEARDRMAEARDQAAKLLDDQFDNGCLGRGLHGYLIELRDRAAGDRMLAAADRRQAAEDRKLAAEDRRLAEQELCRAHLDALPGVHRRESGIAAIQREINRAHHAQEPLSLAFIDVDDLKEVNDRNGHAAGDALLRHVVSALRAGLRSYDPIVRLGGDEFACVMAGANLEDATQRLDQVCAQIVDLGGSISVGLTDLRSDDTLATLMERGDTELYREKALRAARRRDALEAERTTNADLADAG